MPSPTPPAVVVKSPEVVLAIDAEGVENWDLHPDGKRIIVAIADARAAAGPAGSAAVSVSRFIVRGTGSPS